MSVEDTKPFFVTIESVLLLDKNLNNTDKIVYGIISAFSNNKDGFCYLKIEKLSQLCDIEKRTLLYSISRLTTFNYIKKIKKGVRTYYMPTTNAYILMQDKIRKNQKENEWNDFNWLED